MSDYLELPYFDSAFSFYCSLCCSVWDRDEMAVMRPIRNEVCPDCSSLFDEEEEWQDLFTNRN